MHDDHHHHGHPPDGHRHSHSHDGHRHDHDHTHDHDHEHPHDHGHHHHEHEESWSTQFGVWAKEKTAGFGRWARDHRALSAAILAALYLASGLYYVPADQHAVRVRFGKMVPGTVPPGLHYALPYPIERVHRLKINEAQRLSIGGNDLSRALGLNANQADDYLLTGDQNLVRLRAWIQYYVQDPGAYLFRTQGLPFLLESLFTRSMSAAVADTGVDDILTTGRSELQARVLKSLQEECNRLGLGVNVSAVALEEVQAPEEVRDAFLEVANAREDRDRIVQEASGYANQLIPRVRGQAQEALQRAEIYRTEQVNRAAGQSDRFLQVWIEYRQNPEVTAARLFLEAMEDVLPKMKKVILDSGENQSLELDILELQRKN